MSSSQTAVSRKISQVLKQADKSFLMRLSRRRYYKNIHRLTITLHKNDFHILTHHARRHGKEKRLSAFLREAALSYTEQKYLVPENLDSLLREIVLKLRSMGNNLNQIALHANTFKKVTWLNLARLRDILSSVERLITEFVRNPPKT